jgi:hypothetical protein
MLDGHLYDGCGRLRFEVPHKTSSQAPPRMNRVKKANIPAKPPRNSVSCESVPRDWGKTIGAFLPHTSQLLHSSRLMTSKACESTIAIGSRCGGHRTAVSLPTLLPV